jgi:hypothetical protein
MFTGRMKGRLFRGRRRGVEALPTQDPLSAEQKWDEAFLRVESYLHAHGIQSALIVNRITTLTLDEARKTAGDNPVSEPVTLAMAALQAAMAHWYRTVLNDPDLPEEAIRAKGRLALVMNRSEPSWTQQFLATDSIHPELATALREARLQPGPEVHLTNMPPAPLEFMINPEERSTAPGFRGHGLLQAAALWVCILGALGAAWAASH